VYNIKQLIYYFILGLKTIPIVLIKFIIYFFKGLFIVLTIFPKYFIVGLKTILKRDKTIIKEQIKKDNPKKVLITMLLSLIIYLSCVFFISKWTVQQLKINYLANTISENTDILIEEENNITNNNQPNEIQPEEPEENIEEIPQIQQQPVYYPNDYWDYINVPMINVNFDELIKKNPDTVGWIKINNTKVNYPVVQANDNDYYLKHSFNKTKNSGGWIYADYRVNFTNFGKNTIIYGHNLTNRTMFGSLVETQKPYWYQNPDNKYIKFSTPTSNTVWAIFSIYTIEPVTDYLRTNFQNHSYKDYIDTMKSRSIYDFGIDVTEEDKILTLSTCNDSGTKRIVVQAKMVTINYK